MSRTTVLCLPFAGAGAAHFRPWEDRAGTDLQIAPLQLPGRERRIGEPAFRDVAQAVEALLPEALERAGSEPVVLFGHSLGAVLAFELAQRLATAPGTSLQRLFVSGSPGPWTKRSRRATGLPDDEFLARVQEFAGYDHAALRFPEMRELILPTLRADVEMHENYEPSAQAPLPAPITSLRGRDDELVDTERAGEWSKATAREFDLVELPGGHMYLTDSVDRLLDLIRNAVRG
ncbi:thioesterase [Saccharopolyspora hirsuta]|uniref:Thioesterase n=1 Tax=Saccharopolyspora hirsuta TaxID=1837 RepID=A0A5M7BMT9_SACHI|nr:alpha/beta fold hydrolase [Saccharopolyspora hirsuta]KAA5830633.1 thioesterase [Saccharopolyspora hirsuta]